ncbi:MAG: thiamine-phosphate kinase [Candidatus Nitrospinota bacterium M3_3B_026]
MDETQLISLIQKLFPQDARDLLLGIGDDCAAIRPAPGHDLLLTTDTLMEGIHFRREFSSPRLIGAKAASVSFSDIAAMGGCPRFALLSINIPRRVEGKWVDSFLKGFRAALSSFGAALIGGNVSGSKGGISVTVTAVGETRKGLRLDRRGARPGDFVYVTGTPGDSALGLDLLLERKKTYTRGEKRLMKRHLAPEARIEWGQLLAAEKIPSAMIDVSDGVALDLFRLAKASGAAAEISLGSLPLSAQAARMARLGGDRAWRRILTGGEDYELLFTVPPRKVKKLQSLVEKGKITAAPIGKIKKGPTRVTATKPSGQTLKLGRLGWTHGAS